MNRRPKDSADSDQPNLRQIAYKKFKEALFSGQIKPGDFLSQREIVERLDVPLGPVREALKSLEREGIATLLPKRGIRVIRIEKDDFAKAIDARKLVEGEAVQKFAVQGPLDVILNIEEKTRRFREEFEQNIHHGSDIFGEKNRIDFLLHDTMISFLDNKFLTFAFQLATEHVRIFRLNFFEGERSFELPAIEEHLAIIEALKSRDPEAAREALFFHLDGTFKRALPAYS